MDSFNQRKKDILSKADKSNIGKWDKHIVCLCEKINEQDNFYTTSSCSGRMVIIRDEEKKGPEIFQFVSHQKVEFSEFREELEKLEGELKFKQEPPILHVACRDINCAKDLLEKGFRAGFKRSGIITLGKNIIVELNGTDKLEFPIVKDLGEDFLWKVVEKSNFNLERGWGKISSLASELL